MGYFTTPTPRQVWTMGFIGMICLIVTMTWQGTGMEAKDLGVVNQIISYMRAFLWMPIALFFPNYLGLNYKLPRSHIIFYFCLTALLGIATTRRGFIFSGIYMMCITFFFIAVLEKRNIFSKRIVLYGIIGMYLVTGPLADLATAMIVNRQMAKSSSASKTFDAVMQLYKDKERLHTAFKVGTFSNTDNYGDNFNAWSEYYVDNIFLDRFCNLRTMDLTLDYAQRLGYNNRSMHKYFENFLILRLPSPVLDFLGVKINKFDNVFTPGDLMSTNALGLKYQYRGFRVAGETGIGLYLMGYSFYIFALFIYILVFIFFMSLVKTRPSMTIPLPVLCTTYFWFFR